MVSESLFYYIGLINTAYFALKVAQFLYVYIRPSSIMRYKHGAESWALVTGASNGIGLGFARELCRKGFNVVLLGHKPDELERAKDSLQRQSPGVQIKTLLVNAMTVSATALQDVVTNIKDLHITVLINNVGGVPVTHSPFKPLVEYTQQEIDDTIYLNSRFMAQLTTLLLPDLARNGPSLIINVSSAAHVGMPYEVMYSGTKGFVSAFSAALAIEAKCESLPIEVMASVPGNVRSGSNLVPLSWSVPSADNYAKAALARVGCGRPVVPGYWRHALQIFVLESLPEQMRQMALARVMKDVRQNQVILHED